MPTPSWRVIVAIEPTGALSHVDADDAARQVRSEIIALINSTAGLPLLIRSVKIENDEKS